jgi:hypothetical protein
MREKSELHKLVEVGILSVLFIGKFIWNASRVGLIVVVQALCKLGFGGSILAAADGRE